MVAVVQARGEPQLLITFGSLTYPLPRPGRGGPARVLRGPVLGGQTASLPPLRDRLPGLVRGLRRYFRSGRLPLSGHHRRGFLDFPRPPGTFSAPGGPGISRFPCAVFPYGRGVSARAGPRGPSRYRGPGGGLPFPPPASAARRVDLARLHTRPARSPGNASSSPLQAAPPDAGPVGVAIPSPYDSFIHYPAPVSTGAQEAAAC